MSEIAINEEERKIGCDKNVKEDDSDSEDSETEGADEVLDDSDDNERDEKDHAPYQDVKVEAAEQDEDNESLDPRIQDELEKLNSSTDVINKLEVDLEEARHTFRILMRESGQQLERLSKDVGPSSVEKARPYYEARMRARRAHAEAQRAAARFEKASNAHEAAKEMVTLAEEGYKERGCLGFDQAWQEMLNHASSKVNESEAERNASAAEHRAKSMAYSQAEGRVQDLHKSLKRHINKSRTYFELKARFNQILDDQKRQVQVIEETIAMTKEGYADSLKELEKISEEIHQRRAARQERWRKNNLGVRGQGVGAETSSPPSSTSKETLSTGAEGKSDLCQLWDHDGDETDGFRLNVISSSTRGNDEDKTEAKDDMAKPDQCKTTAKNSPRQLDRRQASLGSSSANTTTSASSSPVKSPSYEVLPDSCNASRQKTDGSNAKMNFLTVRKLSDDEFSEADSMTSMEQLDDDQIEQLMLESDGFDTCDDVKAIQKSPMKLKASPKKEAAE